METDHNKKSRKIILEIVAGVVVAVAITVTAIIIRGNAVKKQEPAARYKMVTDSSDSTYHSIGLADAKINCADECEFNGYLLKVNNNKDWYMCYDTDICIEGEDIKSITYTFDEGMGCVGTRKDWPSQVEYYYYGGETDTDKGVRKWNNYLKALDKYCRSNAMLPKRLEDTDTGEAFMIKNEDNPVTYMADEQPDNLYIFINESYIKSQCRDNGCECKLNVTIEYGDGTTQTDAYKIKVLNNDADGTITINKKER